jgi:hypothetical protein
VPGSSTTGEGSCAPVALEDSTMAFPILLLFVVK